MKKSLKNNKYLKIINQIEKTRGNNNINWMQILKIAIKHSPKETIKVLNKINNHDKKISKLVSKIK